MPPSRIDTTSAYKDGGSGGNETTIRVGPLQSLVFEYCLYYGRRFQPAHIVNFVIERGFSTGVDRVKLLKYVHWAIKRLLKRGVVRKVAWGLYELVGDFNRYVGKIKPVRVPSVVGGNETNGTRVSAVRGGGDGGGCGVGLYLDNLRGYTSSGYVNGDRGRVRSLSDLVFFNDVSYFEPSTGLGTSLFDGLGQAIVYYSCVEVPGCGVKCEDRAEWRPPHNFVKEHGVYGTLDAYVSKVAPAAFALWGRVAVINGIPFDVMARYLRAFAPSLFEYFVSVGRGVGGVTL